MLTHRNTDITWLHWSPKWVSSQIGMPTRGVHWTSSQIGWSVVTSWSFQVISNHRPNNNGLYLDRRGQGSSFLQYVKCLRHCLVAISGTREPPQELWDQISPMSGKLRIQTTGRRCWSALGCKSLTRRTAWTRKTCWRCPDLRGCETADAGFN